MSEGFSGSDSMARWLGPLEGDDGPCGADLEYDNDFLALSQAAAGKPETQFEAAVPPDWADVRSRAEQLFERTRDLRVALLWWRAVVNLEGFVALAPGLGLLTGLLETYWDSLHPLPDPDDGDPYARMNALGDLREAAIGLADVRRAVLFRARGFGDVRVRAVELALGQVTPRDDEEVLGREQFSQLFAAAIESDPALRERPAQALAAVKSLAALLNDRVGSTSAPDLKPLQSLLYAVTTVVPEEAAAEASTDDEAAVTDADGGDGGPPAPSRAGGGGGGGGRGLSGGVHSRDDALRAIDMVCEYLERTEPTNPAQLLLRRARRLVNRNFLQLMKELAPEALAEVARVMGVDPDSIELDG